jgi:threonine synthase
MYFDNDFPEEYGITPRSELINAPELVRPADLARVPEPGSPLSGKDLERFVQRIAEEIAIRLDLKKV